MKIKVYVNTWGLYNNGFLGYGWINLGEHGNDELAEILSKNLPDPDPEYFIIDVDDPLKISEYDNLFTLNEIFLDVDDEELFRAINESESFEEAIETFSENKQEHYYLYPEVKNESSYAQLMLDEGLFEIDEKLEMFIDLEKLGEYYSQNVTFTSYGALQYNG